MVNRYRYGRDTLQLTLMHLFRRGTLHPSLDCLPALQPYAATPRAPAPVPRSTEPSGVTGAAATNRLLMATVTSQSSRGRTVRPLASCQPYLSIMNGVYWSTESPFVSPILPLFAREPVVHTRKPKLLIVQDSGEQSRPCLFSSDPPSRLEDSLLRPRVV